MSGQVQREGAWQSSMQELAGQILETEREQVLGAEVEDVKTALLLIQWYPGLLLLCYFICLMDGQC